MSSTGIWNGFTYYYDAPTKPAPGKPWVVVAPTYYNGYWETGIPTELITQLLNAGVFVIGLYMPGLDGSQISYGSQYTELNSFIPWAQNNFGLAEFPSLYAQSKGGLEIIPWARDNPGKWVKLAIEYGACDPLSYPGPIPALFSAYNVPDLPTFETECEPTHNAINGSSAMNGSDMIEWAGTADTTVPLSANGALLDCGMPIREIVGMNHVTYINEDIGNFLIGTPMAPTGTDIVQLGFNETQSLSASGGPQQLIPDNIVTDPDTLYNPTTGLITIKNAGVYSMVATALFMGMPAGEEFWAAWYYNGAPTFVDTKAGIAGAAGGLASMASGQKYLNAGDALAIYAYNSGQAGISLNSTGFATFFTLAKVG